MPKLNHSKLLDEVSEARSIKVNNQIYEMRAAGHDVITLSLGEAYFDIPAPAFDDLPAGKIHHYSHSRGLPLLRDKLAKYHAAESDIRIDPEREILITAGSKIAIFMALTCLLEPGDEVIIPEPLWVSYPDQVRLARGVPVTVPWYRTLDDLAASITDRTRAIIINNPHNPTGRTLGLAELEEIHRLAERHGLVLIADEAYHEFVPTGTRFVSALELDPDKERTIVCNSMSKNYGISGWRVGYLIANRQLTDQIIKVQQHLVTCAPTILCYYLAEHFESMIERTRPQIQRVVQIRNDMARFLTDHGVGHMPGDATFYIFASLGTSRLRSAEFAERLLADHRVGVVPGIGYGASCDGFIRISVGTEELPRLLRGMSALAELISASH